MFARGISSPGIQQTMTSPDERQSVMDKIRENLRNDYPGRNLSPQEINEVVVAFGRVLDQRSEEVQIAVAKEAFHKFLTDGKEDLAHAFKLVCERSAAGQYGLAWEVIKGVAKWGSRIWTAYEVGEKLYRLYKWLRE